MSGSSAGDSAAGLTTGKAAAASQLWRKAVCAPRPLAAAGDHEAAQLLSKVFCSAGRPAEAADHLLIAISYNSNTAG
jgi:thioredoxin-like negative regulator of GroEL